MQMVGCCACCCCDAWGWDGGGVGEVSERLVSLVGVLGMVYIRGDSEEGDSAIKGQE